VVQRLGSIPSNGSIQLASVPELTAQSPDLNHYVADAKGALFVALLDSGLFKDEALAMVNTWEKSYFRNPGNRILYVLPREWTDHLLPLQIQPQPDELKRTLVGRVEVMTFAEEQALLTGLTQAVRSGSRFDVSTLGRFAEPKLRRVESLTRDAQVLAYIAQLVSTLQ
jgi:hypothetical protein